MGEDKGAAYLITLHSFVCPCSIDILLKLINYNKFITQYFYISFDISFEPSSLWGFYS